MNETIEKELRVMQKLFVSFVGHEITFITKASSNELGYTTSDGKMYIAKEHSIMDGLSGREKCFFRFGIFAHEMLHQICSNFFSFARFCNKFKGYERNLAKEMANILEDCAIEYFAASILDGFLLKALRFSIHHIYQKLPEINSDDTEFCQYVNALIQFGHRGFLKGDFKNPLTKEIYRKSIPIFFDGSRESIPSKRLEFVSQLLEISKPLWERESQEALAELSQLMQELGNAMMNGPGIGSTPEQPDDNGNPFIIKQKELLAQLESEEKMGEESGGDNVAETLQSHSLEHSTILNGAQKQRFTWEEYSKPTEQDYEEMNQTMEMLGKKELEVHHIPEKFSPEKLASTFYDIKKIQVKNHDMQKHPNPEWYQSAKVENSKVIQHFTRQLRKILQADLEEKDHHTSGKINLNRLYGPQLSTRVFDKRRSPKLKEDFVVELLIDESGSMHENSWFAKETALILAETFYSLHIPLYVMGFDESNHPRHFHYIKWSNTLTERQSLAGISGRGCNFDGYSIRTATEILKKKRSQHKLLIVMSDGCPASRFYKTAEQGITDTKRAIRDAKKSASVIGILIGNSDIKLLHEIYQNDFLLVEHPEQLYPMLASKMKKIIQTEW